MAAARSLTVRRHEVTAERVPALRELFGLSKLPFAISDVAFEVHGVSAACANALRRVLCDEMLGHALQVPEGGFDTQKSTDPFMIQSFCCARIALVPLKLQISEHTMNGLRLGLDVTNDRDDVLPVYMGDLEVEQGEMPEPLFNPTVQIAFLQPGKRLVIHGIRVIEGYGRDNSCFQVACCATYTHLDLDQYSDSEMKSPESEVSDLSGYKTSCLLADPQHHRLSMCFPATTGDPDEIRLVLSDACVALRRRLQVILPVVEAPEGDKADLAGSVERDGAQFRSVPLGDGLYEGVLRLVHETHTLGALLCRAVNSLAPGVSYVAYEIDAREGLLELKVRHTENVAALLARATKYCIDQFRILQTDFRALKVDFQ